MALSLVHVNTPQAFEKRPEFAAKALSSLYEIGTYLTSLSDWSALSRGIADEIANLVEFDQLALYLYDPVTASLRISPHDSKYSPWFPVPHLALGDGVIGTAASLRRSVRVTDVQSDPRFSDCQHHGQTVSQLAVPLIHRKELVGVVNLASHHFGAFTDDDEWFLSTVAPMLSNAIVNTRLLSKLTQKERDLSADLEAARCAQRGLLPHFKDYPGLQARWSWQPARELGGDFLDSLPHPNQGVVHALGDVSGKGTAAALYGALAQGLMRSEFLKQPACPGDVMKELNRELYRFLPANRFVAMVLMSFDAAQGKIRFVNAGMPRPIMVRQAGVVELEGSSVPLGLLPNSDYPVNEVTIHHGDIIVFASDGLTETHDLVAVLSELHHRDPQLSIDTCLDRFRQLERDHTVAHDDQTLIIWQAQPF